MSRVRIASGIVLGIWLVLLSPASSRADAGSTTDSEQFLKAFGDLKQQLTDLPKKIDETASAVNRSSAPSNTRQELDKLRESVAGLLVTLADNGDLAKLGQAVAVNAQQKLNAAQQDTHFAKDQRDYLLSRWQRVARETETAVAELDTARTQLSELLRVLQTNDDFLVAISELNQAQDNIDLIRRLTEALKGLSDTIRAIPMIAPSM